MHHWSSRDQHPGFTVVLSSFRDHCSLTVLLETDKPVFGRGVLVLATEGFRMKTFQMVFRELGTYIGFMSTGRSSLFWYIFFLIFFLEYQDQRMVAQVGRANSGFRLVSSGSGLFLCYHVIKWGCCFIQSQTEEEIVQIRAEIKQCYCCENCYIEGYC